MTPKDKHQSFSRWLSGDATFQDENMLDQLGQEDAFLAEAMEGYRGLPEENHIERVTKMKAKLRQKSGRRPMMIWMKAAAAVAFIIAALFLLRNAFQPNLNAPLSQHEKTETIAPTSNIPSKDETQLDNTSQKIEEVAEGIVNITEKQKTQTPSIRQKAKADKPKPTVKKPDPKIEEPKSEKTIAEESKKIAIDTPIAPPAPSVETAKENIYVPEKRDIEEIAEMDLEDLNLPEEQIIDYSNKDTNSPVNEADTEIFKNVSGFIKDKNGDPLRGAIVFANNISSFSTVTNIDGSFQVGVDPKIEQLQVLHKEHSPLAVELSGENYFEVSLSEIKSNDKKANGKNSAKRRAQALDYAPANNSLAKIDKASPKNGFINFEKYIQQNLKYPDLALKNNVQGKVQIQFKVNKDGSLSDFKIRKSLGYGCDQEAIRVLKNGPKWDATVETVTIYNIEFKNW